MNAIPCINGRNNPTIPKIIKKIPKICLPICMALDFLDIKDSPFFTKN